MDLNDTRLNRASMIVVSASLLASGVALMLLGITWLPVFGFLFGAPLFAAGIYMLRPETYRSPVEIKVWEGLDRRPAYDSLASQGVVPIAILSTRTQRGDTVDFDAARVDRSSVRLGPNGVKPVPITSSAYETAALHDEDRIGENGVVLLFPVKDAGLTPGEDICVTGETIDGELFYGCDHTSAAAA